MRLATASGRRVEAAPGEGEAARLSVGDAVEVEIGGARVSGRVAEIVGAVDPSTRRRTVRVDLPSGTEPPSEPSPACFSRDPRRRACSRRRAPSSRAEASSSPGPSAPTAPCRCGTCGRGRPTRRVSSRSARASNRATASSSIRRPTSRRARGSRRDDRKARPTSLEGAPSGIAGRLARAFIDSKLTPLFVFFALALGALAIVITPARGGAADQGPDDRRVRVPARAAASSRSSARSSAPLEKAFWSIPGVEYVYSTSSSGGALVIVRFRVGEDPDRALVRVRGKLDAMAADWPRDLAPPLVKARSIDDVPVWAMTFWSPDAGFGDAAAGRGRGRERDQDDPRGLRHRADRGPAARVPRRARSGAARRARSAGGRGPRARSRPPTAGPRPARSWRAAGRVRVEAGGFVQSADELGAVVVAESGGRPVRLADVARVVDGPEEPSVLRHARRAGNARPVPRGHAVRQQATGRQRHHGRARDREEARRAPPAASRRGSSHAPSRATTARPPPRSPTSSSSTWGSRRSRSRC